MACLLSVKEEVLDLSRRNRFFEFLPKRHSRLEAFGWQAPILLFALRRRSDQDGGPEHVAAMLLAPPEWSSQDLFLRSGKDLRSHLVSSRS